MLTYGTLSAPMGNSEYSPRARRQVGSYALMDNTGFELMDMFLCCKFAEVGWRPHQRRGWAHPIHICHGTVLSHPCHICAGTGLIGLTPPASAHVCAGTGAERVAQTVRGSAGHAPAPWTSAARAPIVQAQCASVPHSCSGFARHIWRVREHVRA